jgi:hypothetical protein
MAEINSRRSDGKEFRHFDVNTEVTIANFVTDPEGRALEAGTTLTIWNSAATPVVAVGHYVFLGPAFGNKWGKLETPYLV